MAYTYTMQDKIQLPDAPILKLNKNSRHPEAYYNLACGFDIETTSIINGDIKRSYMYIWQFAIENIVIIGRTWEEFTKLMNLLKEKYTEASLLILVHNLSYEASFLLYRYHNELTNGFYKDKRKPLFFEFGNLRFQDSLSITGCSLAITAKIYNLNHQKLVGDLDYKKLRNSKTKLSIKEMMYVYNDVLILSDFARKLLDEIIPANFNKLPLTKTQLFLNKVFHNMTQREKMHCHDIVLKFEEYIEMNRYLFRGGYVHANFTANGIIYYLVQSVDFTSSYPAVMLHCSNYPIGKFRSVKLDKLTLKRFRKLLQTYACWIDISFINIKRKTNHTIESRSKIKEIGNISIFDNGRLAESNYIRVELTELDFEIYELFYNWDNMIINSIKIAKRGKLPEGLLKTLEEDYIIKAKLKEENKKETIEYILAKQNINSAYGACCKKIPFNNWTFTDDWNIENNNKSEWDVYEEWTDKTNILPFQFACWITSNARYNLLKTVAAVGNDCLYCDTDSMKIVNYEKHKHIIDAYNEHIKELNKPLLEKSKHFADLGMFDENDGFYEEFKTLGAKRYLVKEDGDYHATIAGLPKKALNQYSGDNNLDMMEIFESGLTLNKEDSQKITTHYNDEPHKDVIIDDEGNVEEMSECSSCCLYEIPFNMKLSREYIQFISRSMNLDGNYLA